ncbi:hypothetical protein CYMTET_43287 [Cymbomonas tetramitiformis]|uniref:SHOCT domain-containing protein n=1 Tax=Cymbomonas tetramitiformis TaxID=36881 RepID=A0AAE0C2I2_9CHLO|nr:hypothetical protein CYMTET_43287 [Cymbomonas tetramitiformis]
MDPSSRQELRELHADLQSGMISQEDYDDLKSIVISRIKAKAPLNESPSGETEKASMQSDTVELVEDSDEDLPEI